MVQLFSSQNIPIQGNKIIQNMGGYICIKNSDRIAKRQLMYSPSLSQIFFTLPPIILQNSPFPIKCFPPKSLKIFLPILANFYFSPKITPNPLFKPIFKIYETSNLAKFYAYLGNFQRNAKN